MTRLKCLAAMLYSGTSFSVSARACRDARNESWSQLRQDTLFVTRRGGRTRLLAVAGLGKPPAEGRAPAAMQALGRQAAAAARTHRVASMAIAVLPAQAATAQVRLQRSVQAYAAIARYSTCTGCECLHVHYWRCHAAACLLW